MAPQFPYFQDEMSFRHSKFFRQKTNQMAIRPADRRWRRDGDLDFLAEGAGDIVAASSVLNIKP